MHPPPPLSLCLFVSFAFPPKRLKKKLESEMTGTQQDSQREQNAEQREEAGRRRKKTGERMTAHRLLALVMSA